MSSSSLSSAPKLVKKFEPWKAIIVGIAAVIASLVGLAAMGANARGALDKKADQKDLIELKTDLATERAIHQDVQRRLERIEDKADRNNEENQRRFDELKSLFSHRR